MLYKYDVKGYCFSNFKHTEAFSQKYCVTDGCIMARNSIEVWFSIGSDRESTNSSDLGKII